MDKERLLTAMELKSVLEKIQNGEKDWKEEDEERVIASMLEHIGSVDSELRDKLIYGTFCKLAIGKQLEENLLEKLLGMCLTDNMLFKNLGETKTDVVFTRSFTSLWIAAVLHSDNQTKFLSAGTIDMAKEKMIIYMEDEKDLRGFVPEKGWAHSIAHAADVFDELVKNRYADKEMFAELLTPLWKKALVSESVYVHDEEERILLPIIEMLKRGLEPAVIQNLLAELPGEIMKKKEGLEEAEYWFLIANAKKFLKSFYIRIDGMPELAELQQDIRKCLANYIYF